mgnify:CR=1
MKAPLLIVAATIALAAVLASCSETEKEVAPQPTTASVSLTATSSGSASPAATPAGATPVPVPFDWKTYTDPLSGISFKYPPDLVADVTNQSPQGSFGERDIDVRSPENRFRGFLISIFESNPAGLTLDQFADEFICLRDKQEGSLGGVRAISCTKEVVDDSPEAAVVAEYGGRFFAITAPQAQSEAEFNAVVQGTEFATAQ